MMASDGVSKFFLVYHQHGSMHFDGCKTLPDVVQRATAVYCSLSDREEFDRRIADCRAQLDAIVAWRDKDDEEDRKIEARQKRKGGR